MPIITEAEVRAVYKTARKELKELVDSDDVFNAFHEIRAKYGLHLDHAQNLAMAIDAVILEMKPFSELSQLLADGMRSVDEATRTKVLKDVNDKIFVPLHDLVKKRAETRAETEKQVVAAAAEAARPKIQSVEADLKAAPEVKIAVPTPTPVSAPVPATTAPPPQQSVIEHKLTETSAPRTSTEQVTMPTAVPQAPKAPLPTAPPRYHGSDPYKEPIE